MTDRYHVPELTPEHRGRTLTLPPEESAHAACVMRIKPDDAITLFSGRDEVASATVLTVHRRGVGVRVDDVKLDPNVPGVTVEAMIALPKPERCKELIARLTELGVRSVTPITCHRTQRPPGENLLQKLRRVGIEACKQSRRNRLMTIHPPVAWRDVPASPGAVQWIAHPGGSGETSGSVSRYRIAIGPEGGFTDDEADWAIDRGWTPIGLGSRIYRVETAAVVCATLAIHRGVGEEC